MMRIEIVDVLAEAIATEAGWDHPEDRKIARADAEFAVEILEGLGVLLVEDSI
jgi:hypothetical protein